MSAGLVAYFMDLGKTGTEAREEWYDKAYPRIRNPPNVIWNGYDSMVVEVAAPPFLAPSCNPAGFGDLNRESAIDALGDFSISQTRTFIPSSNPSSKTYDGGNGRVTLIRMNAT